MRCGEVCALRWSDLGDDGTITVSHAFGLKEGGYYLKEPKTGKNANRLRAESTIWQRIRNTEPK